MFALCHLLHSEFALWIPPAGAITKFSKSRGQGWVCSMFLSPWPEYPAATLHQFIRTITDFVQMDLVLEA